MCKKLLDHKINFTLFVTVKGANPNGDPLNGNRPRSDMDGYGFFSAECIKRKIRNRFQDEGIPILLQNPDRAYFDGCASKRLRIEKDEDALKLMTALSKKDTKEEGKGSKKQSKSSLERDFKTLVCQKWLDVRLFGEVFALKDFSSHVLGAVTIFSAKSLDEIDIDGVQNTKIQPAEEDSSSDTMGMRYSVPFAVYKISGSINVQPAAKNGITEDDVIAFKKALMTLFQNDASSARPDGTMVVNRLFWWEHEAAEPKTRTDQIEDAFKIERIANENKFSDYDISWKLDGCVKPEIIDF